LIFTFITLLEKIFKAFEILFLFHAWDVAMEFLLLSTICTLSFSIPMAILFSQIMTWSTLSSRGELVGMQACGASALQLLLLPSLFFLLLSFPIKYLNDNVVPNARTALVHLLQRVKREEFRIEEQRFVKMGKVELYTEKVDGGLLEGIFIYEERERKRHMIYAKMGTVRRGEEWSIILWDGTLHVLDTLDPLEYWRMHFHEYTISLKKDEHVPVDIKGMSTKMLKERHRICKKMNISVPLLRSQIEKRRTLSFSLPALFLVGTAIGRVCRAGKIAGFGATALFSFFYYIMFVFLEVFTKSGASPLLLWLPNVISIFFSFFILRRW
jgi:lipopolysaccharide export LptBFGC system permease protein LptF